MSNDFTISIHGVPIRASAYDKTRAVTIEMTDHFGSSVTIFCGDYALAQDLADAINGALNRHRAPDEKILEAAE